MSAVLLLLSSVAAIYYSINGVLQPETALVYNRAQMVPAAIRLLSLLLGLGGAFILLPQSFKLGGALLIVHSLVTLGCFVLTRDWKGGALEFAFLQVPLLMLCLGYPYAQFERAKGLFG